MYIRYTFLSIQNVHKSLFGHSFGLQKLWVIDFIKTYQLKGLNPKKQRPQELL